MPDSPENTNANMCFCSIFSQADRRVIACVTVFDMCRGKEHGVPVLHPADHQPPRNI